MKIVLEKGWNLLGPGTEMDVNKPVADLLIERGIAKPVDQPGPPKVRIVGRRERTKTQR